MLQQAKAGDVDAISQLLNGNLNPKGIEVTLQPASHGTLSLVLMGPATASRGRVEKYLRDAFQKLAAPSIHKIELSYCKRDSAGSLTSDRLGLSLWQSQIELRAIADVLSQPSATPQSQRSPVDTSVEATNRAPQSPAIAPRAVESSKSKRYANPVSIWLQWQATSLGALLLIYLLGVGISSLVMVPLLSKTGGSIPLNGVVPFLGLEALALVLMPTAGLIIGDVQIRLLRKWLHRIGGWRWMTPLGLLLGLAMAVGLQFVGLIFSGGFIFTAANDAAEAYIQGALRWRFALAWGWGWAFDFVGGLSVADVAEGGA